ncbi:MAG: peptidase M3 [Alphaproteobacteria bacterium]|nr:peptidase M3 [Alphaproteobacteria bacterium]|tara:strand:- start:249 stop:2333 length:2085 start_codon:yes stop_codon:yes gene_type:complete
MSPANSDWEQVNPAITDWTGPLGLPAFDRIDDGDFDAAFAAALPAHLAEIDEIANNREAASFENTIVALERAGEFLDRAASIFWNLSGANTNDTLQALERKLSPQMSRHSSAIMMNGALFARIDQLYQARAELDLDAEADRVLELTWKSFVRSGARLGPDEQARLAEINERLASLSTTFAQNVLADERDYALVLEAPADLKGLPDFLISSMAAAAEERDHAGKHAVTLSRSIIEPFLTFSTRRDLREQVFAAWVTRGEGAGERDNRPIVAEMVKLRAEKAALLGYDSYAHLKLDNTMAKTPEKVGALLETMWDKARARAQEEATDLSRLIAEEGRNHAVAPWDWRHYAEKVRAERYELNEAEIKPYLQLEKMIEAAFDTAGRLFRISFRRHDDVAAYDPDVRVFEVLDAEGARIAVFLADYFARPSKRSGAWMTSFQDQHKLEMADGGDGQIPIVLNVMNFAKAAAGEPVLITMDDARTLFHEFGHALHGMLSDVTYPSISGTSVSRDFVELPSQLFEHWLMVPDVMQRFAVHYETGEPIPEALLAKLGAAQKFNKGFANVEFTSSAMVDMAFHALDPARAADIDPAAFEAEIRAAIDMPDEIVMRHATMHFAHVFAGDGYSAGYYSYMWSGVLDADAFGAFTEAGDPFDGDTAARLHRYIYSSGGSMDPEAAYVAFRGKLPSPDALLEKEGLA